MKGNKMNIIIKGKRGTYRINSDDKQYIVSEEKVVQKDSKTSKKGDKYYGEASYLCGEVNLINYLIGLEVRRSDVTTLLELKDEYITTSNFIKGLFN